MTRADRPSRTRPVVAWSLGLLAAVLYLADLMGLKPPPRILPSVALAIAAVLLGVRPRVAPVDPPYTGRRRAVAIAGLTLQVLLVVPIVPVGLVAPGAGVLTIHGLWLAGLLAAWTLRRSAPYMVLAIPFVTAAAIATTLWIGTSLLGWSP